MKDYLKSLGHPLSRQQALQDLKELARIKPGTRKRGTQWILKNSP